jgi:Domain of unknown function (DUF4159)
MRFGRTRPVVLLLMAALLLVLAASEAQFRQRGRGRSFGNTRIATPDDFDGGFHFCRVAFARDFRGDGGDWTVDWPRADINLSVRLSELTRADVSKTPSGDPNYLLTRLTDDVLFQCPFIMMTEVGSAAISDEEAKRLREYLLKGGFLWADDFWGEYAWEWWEAQLRKVFPASEYPIEDLPPSHPIFNAQFQMQHAPQIASIGHWASTGGGTSERFAESATVHTRAVLDRHGRIMVLMTHNTDLGDSFEREADDPRYFLEMSVPGYEFGVNALLYTLTH